MGLFLLAKRWICQARARAPQRIWGRIRLTGARPGPIQAGEL
jgi:hypothetical protein